MWRYFVGAGAALLLALAGFFLFRSPASSEPKLPALPPAAAVAEGAAAEDPLPAEAPKASARTREQKRFDRYDKDRNDAITREEYLLSRRKAFGKLDVNGDGRLAFDEWAVKTVGKFGGADKDKSGVLTRAEFATTAPKPRKSAPKCACPVPAAAKDDAED
jgi:hypothetical protein